MKTRPKTKNGTYMVAVGNDGLFNKIVYTNGGINRYNIKTILEIDIDNSVKSDTDLFYIREAIYEAERRNNTYEIGRIGRLYVASSFGYTTFDKTYTNYENDRKKQEQRRITKYYLKDGEKIKYLGSEEKIY